MKSFRPRMEPCGTPHFTFNNSVVTLFTQTYVSYFLEMMTTMHGVDL